MAIKVNGTTVIDDSRNFTNIAGGFKTVNGSSVVGSGNISAGASTTYGDVGTYVMGYMYNTSIFQGSTYSGSSIEPGGIQGSGSIVDDDDMPSTMTKGGSSLSGTWRAMGRVRRFTNTQGRLTLFVRIS